MTTATEAKPIQELLLEPEDQKARTDKGRAIVGKIALLASRSEYKNVLNVELIEELMKQEKLVDLVQDDSLDKLAAAIADVCGLKSLDDAARTTQAPATDTVTAPAAPTPAPTASAMAIGDRVQVPFQGKTEEGTIDKLANGWLHVTFDAPIDGQAGASLRVTTPGIAALKTTGSPAPAPEPAAPKPAVEVAVAVEQPKPEAKPAPASDLDVQRAKAAKMKESPNGYYQVLADIPVGAGVFYERKKAKVVNQDDDQAVIAFEKGGDEIALPLTTIILRQKDDGPAETAPATGAPPAAAAPPEEDGLVPAGDIPAKEFFLVPKTGKIHRVIGPGPADKPTFIYVTLVTKENPWPEEQQGLFDRAVLVRLVEAPFPPPSFEEATATPPAAPEPAAATKPPAPAPAPATKPTITLPQAIQTISKLLEERKAMARTIQDQGGAIQELHAQIAAMKAQADAPVDVPEDIAAIVQQYTS